ncbi:MAG: hypothetical protein M5U01_01920 [Ardenticatenaceae bacterium]|nr:hypothetical protein [Ardenticatenaceae bacterium]
MRRLIVFLSLTLTLIGCGRSPTAPTPSPVPTSLPRTPLPPALMVPPPLLYVQGTTLFEQDAGAPPHRLVDLPDESAVLAAAAVHDTVLVLRERAIQRVRLADGSIDTILSFDRPVRFGQLVGGRDGDRAIYQAVANDPDAPFGFRTRIGVYDANGTVRDLPALTNLTEYTTLQPLGFSADGTSLYLLPRGQDPSFARVLVVSLKSGEVAADLPVEGEGEAVLAPGGRLLATTARRLFPDASPEQVIFLYGLTGQPPTRRMVSLPQASSPATGVLWAPDGRFMYFALRPRDPSTNQEASAGLWRLDVETGDVVLVAEVSDAGSQPAALSPNGEWLLMRTAAGEQAILIHLPTATPESFTLPATAIIAGWR